MILEEIQRFRPRTGHSVNEDQLAEDVAKRLRTVDVDAFKSIKNNGLRTLVRRAIRWAYIDILRKSRERDLGDRLADVPAVMPPLAEAKARVGTALREILRRVPTTERTALEMKLGGKTWSHISKALNVPERTIQRRTADALGEIRHQLLLASHTDSELREAMVELNLVM